MTDKPKLHRDSNYCGRQDHHDRECHFGKRDQNQKNISQKEWNNLIKYPMYNSKEVCENSCYLGRTVRDFKYKQKESAAYRNIPYPNERTTHKQQFR